AEWRATWPDGDKGNLIFWTADSTTSVMIDGDEYLSVYPTFDWRHIPGVTAPFALANHYGFDNGQNDTWGVSNGTYGAIAYTYNKHDGTNRRTRGKLGTFFFEDEYVALGAGINSNHTAAIHTTVNQTKSGGDVTVNGTAVAEGTTDATFNADYVYNNKIGYVFPETTAVHVVNENQFGKYPQVRGTGYAQDGSMPVLEDDGTVAFQLWIDHGVAPSNASYAYIVVPNASEAQVADYSQNNHDIVIIANTDKVQAVRHEGLKQTQILFYEAGSLEYAPGKIVSVDGPCGLIIDESTAQTFITESVSNLSPNTTVNVTLTANGTPTTTEFISMENPYAGKSMTLTLGGSTQIMSDTAAAGHDAFLAFDRDLDTYWESGTDKAWISYDMQEKQYVGNLLIRWGEHYATAYEVQYSDDGFNWTTVYAKENATGGIETVPFNSIGRYWRLKTNAANADNVQVREISFKTSSNIALNREVETSFDSSDTFEGRFAVDGNVSTRWAGQRSRDNNWITVDLGMNARLDGVKVVWENAYASEYSVEVSDDGITFNKVADVTCRGGSVQTALPAGTAGRYLRITGVKAALFQYGMSIWELEIYGQIQLDSQNAAWNKPVTDSQGIDASQVTGDGEEGWSSDRAADSLTIDLGEAHQIDSAEVIWGDRYATDYVWQLSSDGEKWTDAVSVTDGKGETESSAVSANARYVRLSMNQSSATGYDVEKLRVLGTPLADLSPDKTALKKLLDTRVQEEMYTPASVQTYREAYTLASGIYTFDQATKSQVDEAKAALKAAIDGLQLRNFGETLATIPQLSASTNGMQTLQVNWTALSNMVDLSDEDMDQIYFFAIVDITREPDREETGMFGNGRVLLRSPNAPNENNAFVNVNKLDVHLGRNIFYFPVTMMTEQTNQMDWSQVQTFRMYIDSVNRFEGPMTLKISEGKLIRTHENPKVKVACVGDSITAGVGATGASTNYVGRLQKLLGSSYIVNNFGNSGKTLLKNAAGGNDYVLTNTYTESLAFEPDVVTIMLGTNDSKDENWNTLSGNYEQELRDLINVYRDLPSHPIVILATSPTAYNRNWNINDTVITGQIAPIQRRVSQEMGCPLIETNANTKGMADKFADGIHPNDAGYEILAGLFADGITDAATRLYEFNVGESAGEIDHENNTVLITLPTDADLTAVTPTMKLMQSAAADPAGTLDLSAPATITVTAPNGIDTRVYTVTAVKEGGAVDKAALQAALDDAANDLSGYAAVTAQAYTEAVHAAQSVLDDPQATQADVDAALQALQSAADGLVALGDVDGKDGVSAADALMALQAATGKIVLDEAGQLAADVDGKPGVTAADALIILQFATGKITVF
ncbi:MAG: discoidin domain-containing protein, partial [Acutalibacteraceae bacterium]